jgi:hypothetical protein
MVRLPVLNVSYTSTNIIMNIVHHLQYILNIPQTMNSGQYNIYIMNVGHCPSSYEYLKYT